MVFLGRVADLTCLQKCESMQHMAREMHTLASKRNDSLLALLKSKRVVLMDELQEALGGASKSTVHRHLKQIAYRSSYNFNGKYYTLHYPDRYDDHGLLSIDGILFSTDGTLTATLIRLVREAQAGHTQRELHQLLQVRLHSILREVVTKGHIDREQVDAFYVYVHSQKDIKQRQLACRREMVALQREREGVTDHIVIQVLLALICHPGAKPADVVRYLYGHSPPITMVQVQAVFDRYDLDRLGQKGGSTIC